MNVILTECVSGNSYSLGVVNGKVHTTHLLFHLVGTFSAIGKDLLVNSTFKILSCVDKSISQLLMSKLISFPLFEPLASLRVSILLYKLILLSVNEEILCRCKQSKTFASIPSKIYIAYVRLGKLADITMKGKHLFHNCVRKSKNLFQNCVRIFLYLYMAFIRYIL